MSSASEFEPVARQDYGPTTSNDSMFEHVLEQKLADNMSGQSIRTPVLTSVPLSSNEACGLEPDSTHPGSLIPAMSTYEKEVEFHIAEKPCDREMSVDALAGIVRLDEPTVDNVGRISYPIIQDGDHSNDATYVENTSATIIQAPISTAIVQNVTKLPHNFTINMDAAVGNIATIQNMTEVSGGGQTLWLPTILATSAPNEGKVDDESSQAGMSQIIITSESYMSNEANLPGARRANIVTENYLGRQKSSKVQILSNISLPKNSNYPTQFPGGKDISASLYGSHNHVYKLSANLVTQKQFNNSVLSTKPPKSQSLINCPTPNSAPIKNAAYSHPFAKGTNLNKTLNKVNNGANLNAVSTASGNAQCHLLSRVVSGPNKATGRKGANSAKGTKNASNSLSGNQKQSRSIKIIQQTGSTHKSDQKNWQPANSASYKSQQPAYGVVDTNNSKVIQKVGSPPHKVAPQPMCLQNVSKGERLILQSPCGPVLISTAPMSTTLPKGPHYVQAGPTPNLRFAHAFGQEHTSNITHISANQQLTAQILQSLSQPKLMLQTNPNIIAHTLPAMVSQEEDMDISPTHEKRIVFGDPSTLLTTDDIVGVEERPNLSEQLGRYSYQTLAFVMLDHTYALPVQKQPTSTATSTTVVMPLIASPTQISSPSSPIKCLSPVITSVSAYEIQSIPVTASILGPLTPVNTITMGALTYKPQTLPVSQPEDDAGSVISSVEGDKKPEERAGGGSDTETAPEGEEEGKTRCICEFTHDDGYMICCDRCGEWQHVDCMGIDRQNIPDAYMCEICNPRHIDRKVARSIQMRKREELCALGASDTETSEPNRIPGQRRKRLLTVTTYTNTTGTGVTTYNSNAPVLPSLPIPTLPAIKRNMKRPKKTEVVRKAKRKLTEKRIKRKKEMLMNRTKFTNPVPTTNHTMNWQDSYETAMTNHYSQELRAKILKYSSKLGNSPNMASAITAHLCTTVPHAGGKILIATKDLKENTPIIELRGKYMLSNQHKPQLQSTGRMGSQKPGPFVFFYRLPKDNIQVCIDTRTYGNEARYVRRSCKPNAELQHCILKGTLHVYLVSIGIVPSNTEITVGHDSNSSKQPCACGNPKHCKMNGMSGGHLGRRSIDAPPKERRSRNRLSSSSSPASPPPVNMSNMFSTPTKEQPLMTLIKSEKKSPIKQEFMPMSPTKLAIPTLIFEEPIKPELECKEEMEPMDLLSKEELKSETDEPDCMPPTPIPIPTVISPHIELPGISVIKETKSLTETKDIIMKEEPKPIVPALEEPVKFEVKEEKMEKAFEKIFSDDEKHIPQETYPEKCEIKAEEDRRITREAKAKSACHDRSSRTSRTTCTNQDSLDDKTDDSQDKFPTNSKEKEKDKRKMTREERKMEAIMKAFERMEKQQQRKMEVKERQKRRESDPHPNAADKDDDDDHHCVTKRRRKRKGRARTTSQTNRCRLNSVDSDMVTSGDEAVINSPRKGKLRRDSLPNQSTPVPEAPRCEIARQDLGLSSACLLVEAAVGSVESAFKLPKTKKTMANEWLGRSPERTPSPYRSPYRPSLVPATSLESLVRVASTMIGDLGGGHSETEDGNSPPRTPGRDRSKPPKKSKRILRNTPPTEIVEVQPAALPQHSAKKRWLRQAISEECDSPNIQSPPNEMVTPLKKRRLARESLSIEQITIPTHEETSQTFTSDHDSPLKDDRQTEVRPCKVRNIMESLYGRDRSRSDSGQGSDDQSHLDNDVLNVNLKITPDSENIRRIIGVPGTEIGPPAITKIEDIKTINNNISETKPYSDSDYNKVVPMEIDTTILPRPQIKETIDITYCDSRTELPIIISPRDKLNPLQSHSCDTSGNSSPQRDEMDDIQKKIHSFHTENILMLKSRNKKPPKEKRKKVNLNFDLNMVDDQISIQLRTDEDVNGRDDGSGASGIDIPLETIPLPDPQSIPLPNIPPPGADGRTQRPVEINGDLHDDDNSVQLVPMDNIPLPPVETIPLPDPQSIPLPAMPQPDETTKPPPGPAVVSSPIITDIIDTGSPIVPVEKPLVLENSLSFTSRFSSTGLFSGIFSNMNPSFNLDNQINDNVPNMQIIKSAIDRTTSLDSKMFDKETISSVDELKNVQEILSRVNNMDSNNSVLLSGVLNVSDAVGATCLTLNSSPSKASKAFFSRVNDPRLNPPPTDKPKPIRRKLSINEYRKRNKGASLDGECSKTSSDAVHHGECSSESSGAGSMSPLRLEAAAAAATDELELRLHKALTTPLGPKGVFDAKPTASERQRENLSSRLRREFGLSLPDDEEARPPTDTSDVVKPSDVEAKRCER